MNLDGILYLVVVDPVKVVKIQLITTSYNRSLSALLLLLTL